MTFGFLGTSHLVADDHTGPTIYITPDQIQVVGDTTLQISLSDGVYISPGVYMDIQGLYVYQDELIPIHVAVVGNTVGPAT